MSTLEVTPRKTTRSRAGCERCRRRRQKCDQQKPSCGRCAEASIACKYELKLNWGGRSFRKSTFGKCLSKVERLDNDSQGDGFVYCLPGSRQHSDDNPLGPGSSVTDLVPVLSNNFQDQITPDPPLDEASGSELVPTSPSNGFLRSNTEPRHSSISNMMTETWSSPHTPTMTPMAHHLLQFYISETMRLTAPSTYARTQICCFLVPMALQQPSLLYAIMAFAAVHLQAVGGLRDNAEKLIDTLQSSSISHLRHQLVKRDPTSRVVSLATTRTLCQAQIYSGKPLWRLHLSGARAILESAHVRDATLGTCSCTSTEEGFLMSWYNNAEGLAALTPAGLPGGKLGITCPSNRGVFFDVFGGVMSDLPDLFREVGALVKENRRRAGQTPHASILSDSDIAVEADALCREIHYRLQRNTADNLALNPRILLTLSANDIKDYALSNAAFLYTALLHIYCGVQRRPSSGPEAQLCVQNIIWCAQSMNYSSGLSPRVLLVAPLFAAGLCAVGSGRDSARSALADIGSWMKTPHLSKTVTLLEQIWSQSNGDPGSGGVWAWFERISFDFLPY